MLFRSDELGQLLLDADMLAEAEAVYHALAKRLDGDARLLNQLAVTQLRRGRLEAGIQTLRRAVRLDRQYAIGLFNLAKAYADAGDLHRAAAVARRGVNADPSDARLSKLMRSLQRRRFLRRWLGR